MHYAWQHVYLLIDFSFSATLTMVNLMTSFSASPLNPPFLTSILLNTDSNLTCHVLLACGSWLKDFTGTLTALLDNQMLIFLALHTCWTRFLNVWARRGYKQSIVHEDAQMLGKCLECFSEAAADKVDTFFFFFYIQFSVTENTVFVTVNNVLMLPCMPLPRYHYGRKV